jgi:GTP-binding protein HflX
LRGAGETQLELDQRMIAQRIKSINKSLGKVRRQRQQGRRSRQRAELPTISLVGYTNAGKSSLFNRITQADNYVADKLFATLDSTLRRIDLPNYGAALMADTVGFISHLPHELVEAFRATLEETAAADLLLHIIDAANESHQNFIGEVNSVLTRIGADSVTQLQLMNKIDLIPGQEPEIQRDESGMPVRVWVSAKTGAGLELLYVAISELLAGALVEVRLQLDPEQTRLRSQLYARNFIEAEQIDEVGHYLLSLRLPRQDLDRILQQTGTVILKSKLSVSSESIEPKELKTA